MSDNKIFDTVAYQVFVACLQDGPKKSWELRRSFYGEAYLSSSSKKNNAAYNRNRKHAVKLNIMVKNDQKMYELSSVGKELLAWAKAKDKDLSTVKSEARVAFEVQNGIV